MKPVISYYGGKQRMASKIIPLIPKHTVYVEPFCEGATILFGKPWPDATNNNHYREVINDSDHRLVNFYEQLRNKGDELVRQIQLTPFSEREYAISLREGLECEDKLEAARRYYVNIQQSFSNKLDGGWARVLFTRNSSASWANKIDGLQPYVDRMSSAYISCQDALKVIKQWDSPQSFFYCDPPYPETNCGNYKGYTIEDFQNLIDALDSCQGSFLLSCYDVESVTIPHDWERFTFETHCSSSGKGKVGADRSRKATSAELGNRKRTEVVYRRFNRVPVRPEIQKLYDSGKFDCFASPPEKTLFDEVGA